jgi:hypothetical protein
MVRRPVLTVVLLGLLGLLALLTGCGDDGADAPAAPLGRQGLGRALERARAGGRVPMQLTVTTTRPGRGTRPQFSADGELDLAVRAGKATLHMSELPGGVKLPDLPVSWTAGDVTAGRDRIARSRARIDGGQLGMLSDETQALAELVADATDIRERDNGHWTFTVRAADAVQRGIPPQPESGDTWQGAAWAGADGTLRRVALTVPTPALGPTIAAGVATIELRLG